MELTPIPLWSPASWLGSAWFGQFSTLEPLGTVRFSVVLLSLAGPNHSDLAKPVGSLANTVSSSQNGQLQDDSGAGLEPDDFGHIKLPPIPVFGATAIWQTIFLIVK